MEISHILCIQFTLLLTFCVYVMYLLQSMNQYQYIIFNESP